MVLYVVKSPPFFLNPWRSTFKNTPFCWNPWTMPPAKKHPLSPCKCGLAYAPLLDWTAVTGARCYFLWQCVWQAAQFWLCSIWYSFITILTFGEWAIHSTVRHKAKTFNIWETLYPSFFTYQTTFYYNKQSKWSLRGITWENQAAMETSMSHLKKKSDNMFNDPPD